MSCPSCVVAGADLCESPVYRESPKSGWHIGKSEDIHAMTTSLCGLIFPAKTRSEVAPEMISKLCAECRAVLHPEIKVVKAAECWDDD